MGKQQPLNRIPLFEKIMELSEEKCILTNDMNNDNHSEEYKEDCWEQVGALQEQINQLWEEVRDQWNESNSGTIK